MRNAVLHLITNKSGDFGSALLPSYSTFNPVVPSSEETALREALKINDGLYYLLNSMAAVYAFPFLLADFKETETTFKLSDFRSDPLQVYNATYFNTPTNNFSILLKPTTFPEAGYFNWTISYNDEDTLNIKCCNKAYTISYTRLTASSGAPVITATWPAETGMQGGFQLPAGASWSSGYFINLTVPALTFPYAVAVAKASQLPGTAKILNDAGLARNFANAQSAIEKYGTLMLALARPDIRNTYAVSCDLN